MREGVLNVTLPIAGLSAPATGRATVDVVVFGVFRLRTFPVVSGFSRIVYGAVGPTRPEPDRATVEGVLERLGMM